MFACLSSLTLQGNAWGLITGKDGFGFPTGIEWIPPSTLVIAEPSTEQPFNPLMTNVYADGMFISGTVPIRSCSMSRALPSQAW